MGTGSIPPPNPLAYEGQVVVPYILRTNPVEPETTFNKFPVPTVWINPSTKRAWLLVSITLGIATWIEIASGGTGPLLEFAGGAGTTGFPVNPSDTGVVTLTSTGGTITITGTTNAINFDLSGGTTAIDSLTTDVSGPVLPTAAGAVACTGSTTTYTTGAVANTLRTEVQGTNHGVFIGQGTQTPATTLAVGATHSILGGVTGSDPAFSTTLDIYATSISFNSGTDTLSVYKDFINWTPQIKGGTVAGTTTYGTQSGTYTRIGAIIVAQCQVDWTNMTGTGDIVLFGFPYSFGGATARAPNGTVRVNNMTWPVGVSYLIGYGQDATTELLIEGNGDSIGVTNLQAQATGDIALTIVYQTSQAA